jgi:hypothetical protein
MVGAGHPLRGVVARAFDVWLTGACTTSNVRLPRGSAFHKIGLGPGHAPRLALRALPSAAGAIEAASDHRRAAFRRQHPGAFLPRRLMPDVLSVAALQVRDPVAFCVLMEADDRPPHASPPARSSCEYLTTCASGCGQSGRRILPEL